MMRRLVAWLDLCDCTVRLAAAMLTRNEVAAWNVLCDVEDAHRRLGHDYNEVSKDRPWDI
jgi:hypothetical protein